MPNTASQSVQPAPGAAPTATAVGGLGVDVTVLGGPTVVLDIAGLRLLTDPTFDPPGEYVVGKRSLVKTAPAAWAPGHVGRVAAVLLSHDQHPDNLDRGGRSFLASAPLVLTTPAAAGRLGASAVALAPWASTVLTRPDGGALRVTTVPARHGPAGTEHLTGEVTGFVLTADDAPTIYVSGDNASLDLVRAIAKRFDRIDIAVLFAGGAKTALLGDAHLTLSSAMAARATQLLGRPRVVAVHTDGWAHFTESAATLPAAFAAAGVVDMLVPTMPGVTVRL